MPSATTSSGRRRSGATNAASRSSSGPARSVGRGSPREMPEMAADLAEVVLDPPDRTFAETAYVDVGDRRVELRHIGLGHTDHDIVIKVPDAAVTFAGDLIENGAVPAFGDALSARLAGDRVAPRGARRRRGRPRARRPRRPGVRRGAGRCVRCPGRAGSTGASRRTLARRRAGQDAVPRLPGRGHPAAAPAGAARSSRANLA